MKGGDRGAELVGDRNSIYGDAVTTIRGVARAWTVLFGIPVTPEQVCLAMMLLKAERDRNEYNDDNRDDMQGYLEILHRSYYSQQGESHD